MIYLISYLIGSINFSYLLIKLFKKQDIRELGSKNAGGTNVLRNFGPVYGISVYILDILKGVIAIYITKIYTTGIPMLSLFCASVGHCFPIFLGFRGGKGVAITAGGLFFMFPCLAPFALAFFAAVFLLFRIISVASIASAIFLSVLIFFTKGLACSETIGLALCLSLVIFMHRSNIKRLINGEENKLTFGGKKR